MAIVFSYPTIGFNDIQASDRLLISQMTIDGNPTRSITVNNLRQYLGAQGTVTSVGLSMPPAFNVIDSPVTSAGTLKVKGAGTPTDFIDGEGNLQPIAGLSGVGGSGTINTLPVFTAPTTIGDSMVSQNAGATIASINGELNMNGNKITNLAGPILGSDAVDKNSLDSEITAVKNTLGYKSVQVFQWPNGNPVAYINFPIGTTSALPFNTTPLVETGTYTGTAADFAWTCVNQAGGTATQFAEFTLGINGGGTWEISTAQHWFDQNQFLEVNVDIRINGVTNTVIDERVNDGAGDRLFYGSITREFTQGNTVRVEITFANGTGSNPFPAATGNRPIEVTFNKLV
mgnify:FL=1